MLLAMPHHVRGNGRGLSGREVETVSRACALSVLVSLRVDAARLLIDPDPSSCAEHVSRALGVPVPAGVAALIGCSGGEPRARVRAWAGALVLADRLRDAFDEDWYRNPRAEEPLRAAAERGGALSIEALCGELGEGDDVTARLATLFC
jgi:hypothetical protein